LEEMITSSNDVFKDVEPDMPVDILKLVKPPGETAENNDTVKQTGGSEIFSLQLQGKSSD
jgi:hypothetical protein